MAPHYRSHPDGNFWNNWSTRGNVNPFTGKVGTKDYPNGGWIGKRNSKSVYNTPLEGVTADYAVTDSVVVKSAEPWTGIPSGATLTSFTLPNSKPIPLESWDQLVAEVISGGVVSVKVAGNHSSGEAFSADLNVLAADQWSGTGYQLFKDVILEQDGSLSLNVSQSSPKAAGQIITNITCVEDEKIANVSSWDELHEYVCKYRSKAFTLWFSDSNVGSTDVTTSDYYLNITGSEIQPTEAKLVPPATKSQYITFKGFKLAVGDNCLDMITDGERRTGKTYYTLVAIRVKSASEYVTLTSKKDLYDFIRAHPDYRTFVVKVKNALGDVFPDEIEIEDRP